MSLSTTNFAAMLKRYYLANNKVENLARQGRQLLSLLPKQTDFGGEEMKVPVLFADPASRSASYAVMAANRGRTQQVAFTITRKRSYASVQFTREVMKAAEYDKLAFMRARTTQINGMINHHANDLELDLFRDGTGVRGRRAGALAGNIITLSDPADAWNFEVGMLLGAADGTGPSDTVRVGASPVIKVDRVAGTVEVANAGAIASFTADDYLFNHGDQPSFTDATTATGFKKVRGLQAWLPATVGGSDSFNGVNRSIDRERLAGNYYDAAANSDDVEEAFINGGARLYTASGAANNLVGLIHPTKFAELAQLLDNQVQRSKVQTDDAKVSFKSIEIHTGAGTIDVISAPACPKNEAFVLDLKTWCLASLDKAPHLLIDDGGAAFRQGDADALNVEIGHYADLYCKAPVKNLRIKLA